MDVLVAVSRFLDLSLVGLECRLVDDIKDSVICFAEVWISSCCLIISPFGILLFFGCWSAFVLRRVLVC